MLFHAQAGSRCSTTILSSPLSPASSRPPRSSRLLRVLPGRDLLQHQQPPASTRLTLVSTRRDHSLSRSLISAHLGNLVQRNSSVAVSLSPLSPRPLTAISASQSCALRSAKACGLSAAPRSLPHLTALSSQRSTAAWPANRNQRRNSSVTSAVRPAVGDTCPCQVDHSR